MVLPDATCVVSWLVTCVDCSVLMTIGAVKVALLEILVTTDWDVSVLPPEVYGQGEVSISVW